LRSLSQISEDGKNYEKLSIRVAGAFCSGSFFNGDGAKFDRKHGSRLLERLRYGGRGVLAESVHEQSVYEPTRNICGDIWYAQSISDEYDVRGNGEQHFGREYHIRPGTQLDTRPAI
jgi:hypothetical protein